MRTHKSLLFKKYKRPANFFPTYSTINRRIPQYCIPRTRIKDSTITRQRESHPGKAPIGSRASTSIACVIEILYCALMRSRYSCYCSRNIKDSKYTIAYIGRRREILREMFITHIRSALRARALSFANRGVYTWREQVQR